MGAVHRGFDGHHEFDAHRVFHPGLHSRFFFTYPYYGYYPPVYEYNNPPVYWYYCPSYGEYYPNVTSCPDAWVPVPAS